MYRQLVFVGFLFFVFSLLTPQNGKAQIDPVRYHLDRLRSDLLYEHGNIEAAFSLIQRLNRQYELDSEQWWLEGRMAASLKRWNDASYALIRSFELGTVYPAVTARRIAEAYAHDGKFDDALEWLEIALSLGLESSLELAENPIYNGIKNDPRFQKLAGFPTLDLKHREERWKYDIDFLVTEAKRMHNAPNNPAFSVGFRDAADFLKENVTTLSDTEVMMELRKLVSILGDGHSYVRLVAPHPLARNPVQLELRTLPIVMYSFAEGIFIINGSGDAEKLIGGRIIDFGGVSTEELQLRATPYLHADHSESWKFLGVHFSYRSLAFHQALGSAGGSSVMVSVEFEDGRRASAKLAAGDYSFPRKLRPMPKQEAIPNFLSKVDTTYWRTTFASHGLMYAQVNRVRNSQSGATLPTFIRESVDEALSNNLTSFALDLRLNNGGNNALCGPIVREVLRYEFANPVNQVFVITGSETFSAAQNCINRISEVTNALFVGQHSSSSPNFTGEDTEVILPFSGLSVSISNRYWQDAQPWDDRSWIPMDVPAPITFRSYHSGQDPALDAIFRIISK